MKLLLDAQLPPALAGRLSQVGHEAVHLFDLLPGDASDGDVASAANRLGAILMSKDEDFVDLAARGVLTAPLLWIRSGNMTTARLWALIEPLLPEIERAFAAGEKMVEIR